MHSNDHRLHLYHDENAGPKVGKTWSPDLEGHETPTLYDLGTELFHVHQWCMGYENFATSSELTGAPAECCRYNVETLGAAKHEHELTRSDLVHVFLDHRHMGIGGDDSWSPSVLPVPQTPPPPPSNRPHTHTHRHTSPLTKRLKMHLTTIKRRFLKLANSCTPEPRPRHCPH